MSSVPAREVIVQFMWPGDDEGDYLAFRTMSEEEIAETEDLLKRAEELSIIRAGWYIGPLEHSDQPYTEFIKELRDDLNIDCRCVPTLNEVHPDCPFHGFEEE